MSLVYKDRVKETTTTTGTGALTLGGAATGFQPFSALGDGSECVYVIEDANGTDWEVGTGTYTAAGTTLSRDKILSSTTGSAINLSAGTHTVYCTVSAEDMNLLRPTVENGFVDRSHSVVSFDNATRTFTIQSNAPTHSEYEVFSGGNRYVKTGADTVVIAATEGLHYIYFDPTGTLVETTAFDIQTIIVDNAFVALLYWDATNLQAIIFGDERHGRMPAETHKYLHESLGSQYVSGLGLGDITPDGNGNDAAHAQFSVADGVIRDEDIRFEIASGSPQTLSAIAEIPLFYRSGAAGSWRRLAATTYPVTTTGSGRAAWNEWAGATWQLTEAANNGFVLTHLFATTGVNHPIIGIVGQSEYSKVADARAGAVTELNALLFGALEGLLAEWVPIATVIYQTADNKANAVKSSIVSTEGGDAYIDWRESRSGSGGGGVTSLSDLGITATATELNYVDGVTSSIQTQLNTLAAGVFSTINQSPATVSETTTVTAGQNAISAGPNITIANGVTVTVGANAHWRIL